jgi:sugar-specific transcriptional regulator TrmB
MDDISDKQKAVEQLQQLGLKEYEARAFVALARLPSGTAKDISEISEVPRTRVYEAVRVLESKGLVEIQHSNPQVFRALSVKEAVETLLDEYRERTEQLQTALTDLEPAEPAEEVQTVHEVWALSGSSAIANRTEELVGEAESELALVLGGTTALTDDLLDCLVAARDRGVSVLVGTTEESIRDQLERAVPEATVFVSGLTWLRGTGPDEPQISRILLVDRETILLSSSYQTREGRAERAVFGRGFKNGIVTIVRRLIEAELGQDAGTDTS